MVKIFAVAALVICGLSQAQTLSTRRSLTLEGAKQIAAAAEAEAAKNKWNVVIAIVDEGGHLIYLQRMDDTQIASVEIAPKKAQTAAMFKRPSKVFEDRANAPGGVNVLALPGVVPSEGGLPIIVDGKVIGGIGVSGVMSSQDGVVAKAGLEVLGKMK
jgi:glc operon protein GlcG